MTHPTNQDAEKREEAANDYVIITDHSEVTAISDAFIAGATWQSQQPNEELNRYRRALEEAKQIIEKDYRLECDKTDWFNNNMPGVGQTIDYRSRPAKPQALQIIDEALNPPQP